MSMKEHRTGARERGAVLIISLMILILMTVFGISTMDTNILEEKMAGNMRDRNLAFQSAESALRVAEGWIAARADVSISAGGTGPIWGIKGPDDEPDNGIAWWDEQTKAWWDDNGVPNAGADVLSGVAAQPAYIIEKLPEDEGPVIGPLAEDNIYLQVTARGVGGSASTVVVLQSVYKW